MSLMLGSIITRATNAAHFNWIREVSKQVDELSTNLPGPFSSLSDTGDGLRSGTIRNSLCEQNLSFPEWVATSSTRRFAHMSTDSQLLDAVQLNPLGNAAGNGEFKYPFVLPPGSNGCTFTIDLAEAASKNVTIGIYDSNFSTVLASQVCATAATFRTFNVSLPSGTGVPVNHLYWLFVQTNIGAVQATPFAANAKCVPTFPTATFGTGTFAADPVTKALNFRRITLSQALSAHNQLNGVNSGLYPYLNGYGEFSIELTSNFIAVEAYNFGSAGVYGTFLNGGPLLESNVVPNGTLGMQDYSLAQSDDLTSQIFKVRTSPASGPLNTTNMGTGAILTVPRVFYLPGGASFTMIPARGQQRCIVAGDSITLGFQATSPTFQGWFSRFREWYPGEVIADAYQSQGFLNYVGSATPPQDHPQLQLLYAQYLCRRNPTDIIFDLGVNDYINGNATNVWTAAAFETALLGLVVNLMALAPQARIWLKSMGITTLEAVANAAGSTPPNYRTAVSNVVTAIADPRVIFIDGTGALFYVVGDLVDTVHPNTAGQQKAGEAMIAAFQAAFAI